MDIQDVSQKRINEMEQLTMQLLKTMRRSQLHVSPLYTSLQDFERQLSEERRKRYDNDNSTYQGY